MKMPHSKLCYFIPEHRNEAEESQSICAYRFAVTVCVCYLIISDATSFTCLGPPLQLMTSYTHLDLLAPMPDVEVDKSRVLMLEGNLKYREQHNTNRVSLRYYHKPRFGNRNLTGLKMIGIRG